MSERDTIEEIRQEKRQQLAEQLDGEENGGEAAESTTEERAGAPDEPVHVEGADHLDDLVAEHDVVLADFYADWCGPCQMLEPVVAAVAEETEAAVVKVDIDAHRDLAGQYRVQGVPTMVLFADGEPAERLVGVQSKDDLMALVERVR
jgi:thioredoxin 1